MGQSSVIYAVLAFTVQGGGKMIKECEGFAATTSSATMKAMTMTKAMKWLETQVSQACFHSDSMSMLKV